MHLDIEAFVNLVKVLLRIEFEQPLIFLPFCIKGMRVLVKTCDQSWRMRSLFFLSKRSIKEHFSVAHKKTCRQKSHVNVRTTMEWNKVCFFTQNVGLSSCRQVSIKNWKNVIQAFISFFLTFDFFYVVANCILEISSVDHFQFLSQYTWSLETAELQDHPTLDMKQVHLRHFMLQLPLKPNRLTLKTMKMTKKVRDQHEKKSTKLFEEIQVKCNYFAINIFWNCTKSSDFGMVYKFLWIWMEILIA